MTDDRESPAESGNCHPLAERLRARAKWHQAADAALNREAADELEAKDAEILRLRSALNELALKRAKLETAEFRT